ncbi:unnamed protein product, partial [Rotaria magnacalcarata]
HAFTRILPFYQAFLICIRTVEYSDPSLLINIDPKLSIVGFYPIPSINDATNQSNISPSSIVASNGKSKDDTQQKLRKKMSSIVFPCI